jgi:hypothetical protein
MARQWMVEKKHEVAELVIISTIGLAVLMSLLTFLEVASAR